jgi:hypothetical protein
MNALYHFVPLFCPSNGTPTRLDRVNNAFIGKYQAHQTLFYAICGVMSQLATKTDLLRAATASGGDLVKYFIEDDAEVDTQFNRLR